MTDSLVAIFHEAGRELELRRIPLPEPGESEVLVRILGCTLCGSDLHTYAGRRDVPVPTILGHEIVGEILAFGESAPRYDLNSNELQPGDHITWSIVANCSNCFYCHRGLPQKCLNGIKYGHEQLQPGKELSGGLAEHCLLQRGTAIVRVPKDMPLSVVCPASCATATVSASLTTAGPVQNQNVCVMGVGMLGLTAVAMLHAQEAASIVCVDVKKNRLATAEQFGATEVCRPDELEQLGKKVTGRFGFDYVFEFSGSTNGFVSGLKLLRKGGKLISVGAVFPTDPACLPLDEIVRRNLVIQGVHNYAPGDLQSAVNFLVEFGNEYPFESLVSRWYPLESVNEALQSSAAGDPIRIGIR